MLAFLAVILMSGCYSTHTYESWLSECEHNSPNTYEARSLCIQEYAAMTNAHYQQAAIEQQAIGQMQQAFQYQQQAQQQPRQVVCVNVFPGVVRCR